MNTGSSYSFTVKMILKKGDSYPFAEDEIKWIQGIRFVLDMVENKVGKRETDDLQHSSFSHNVLEPFTSGWLKSGIALVRD